MSDVYLVPGKRTPFVRAGGRYAEHDAIAVSRPVVQAMAERARADFLSWGQVIPSATVSNLGRELLLEAGLDPTIPAFSSVLACSTSMVAAIVAAGMLGGRGNHLALVGGVETMSHVPIALTAPAARRLMARFAKSPQDALATLGSLTPEDFSLPIRGWANRISGRSMGGHTEDTAKRFRIARVDQDRIALGSHQRALRVACPMDGAKSRLKIGATWWAAVAGA